MRNLNITKQVKESDESINVAKKPSEKNIRKTKKNVERVKKIAKRSKKRNENKEARLNRRADRLAAKKGFEGSGVFNEDGTPDNESLMQARAKAKKLMKNRRAKGKKFFVDMAKNLGGIDNAYSTKPLTQNKKDALNNLLSTFGVPQDSNVITENNSQAQIEATNATAANLDASIPDYKSPMDIASEGFSGLDSSPINYMQKEYRKKRGY